MGVHPNDDDLQRRLAALAGGPQPNMPPPRRKVVTTVFESGWQIGFKVFQQPNGEEQHAIIIQAPDMTELFVYPMDWTQSTQVRAQWDALIERVRANHDNPTPEDQPFPEGE